MKLISIIPGFRTKTLWKMIIAGLVYAYSIFIMFQGLGDLILAVTFLISMAAIGIISRFLTSERLFVRGCIYFITFIVIFILGASIAFKVDKPVGSKEINDLLIKANNQEIKDTSAISDEEHQAINLLSQLLNAYNAKDVKRIKQIDLRARNIPKADQLEKLKNVGNFKLHYVGLIPSDKKAILGRFLYSNELKKENNLEENINLHVTCFVLIKYEGSWKLAAAKAYDSGNKGLDYFKYISELQEKAEKKYGTDNLADLSN